MHTCKPRHEIEGLSVLVRFDISPTNHDGMVMTMYELAIRSLEAVNFIMCETSSPVTDVVPLKLHELRLDAVYVKLNEVDSSVMDEPSLM